VHVDRVARSPAVALARGALGHRVAPGRHALAVEAGLHEAALAEVELPLAREQSLAEQHLRALEPHALGEGSLLRHQHVADVGEHPAHAHFFTGGKMDFLVMLGSVDAHPGALFVTLFGQIHEADLSFQSPPLNSIPWIGRLILLFVTTTTVSLFHFAPRRPPLKPVPPPPSVEVAPAIA